jgi:hypothetical protein
MMEAGAARCADSGGIPVNYTQLPQAMWTELRQMFAIPETEAATRAMQAASRMDAKNPSMEFARNAAGEPGESMSALVETFAAPAYRRLEAARAARLPA